MKGIRVKFSEAEKTKKYLIEKNALEHNYKTIREKNHLIFPLKKIISDSRISDYEFEQSTRKPARKLKEILQEKLPADVVERIKTAHDIIGDIAILEIDEMNRDHEKIIAEALLEENPAIKTVIRKDARHEGEFRTQKMKHLAGKKTKETIHKENNVRLKLNVETVYFSPRMSTERKRIAEQIEQDEKVLVMFSGCAPYPCVIAKNSNAKEIVGVEINPEGQKYGEENLKLNKIKNTTLYCGDVDKKVPSLGLFNRVVMPAPKNAEDHLETALDAAMNNSTIHFYAFLHEDDFAEAEDRVRSACNKKNLEFTKLNLVKCGQHAPRVFRICLDFKVTVKTD